MQSFWALNYQPFMDIFIIISIIFFVPHFICFDQPILAHYPVFSMLKPRPVSTDSVDQEFTFSKKILVPVNY